MTCNFELLRKLNSRIEADWKVGGVRVTVLSFDVLGTKNPSISGRGVRVANPQNFILGWATLLQNGLVGLFRGFPEFENIASDIPVCRLIGETRKSQVFVMFTNPKVKCTCKF